MKKMKKARTDMLLMLLMMALCALVYFWLIPTQIQMTKKVAAQPFNPATFPKLLTIGMFIISSIGFVIYLVTYLKLKKTVSADGAAEAAPDRSRLMAELIPLGVFALALVYALLFKYIGFIPATILVPPVLLLLLGCRKWYFYAAVYVFSAVMYAVFRFVLLVPIK